MEDFHIDYLSHEMRAVIGKAKWSKLDLISLLKQ